MKGVPGSPAVSTGKYANYRLTNVWRTMYYTLSMVSHVIFLIYVFQFFRQHQSKIEGLKPSYFGLYNEEYDNQLQSFLGGLKYIFPLIAIHVGGTHIIRKSTTNHKPLIYFNTVLGFCFVLYLYGAYTIHATIVILINYLITKLLHTRYWQWTQTVTWVFNLLIFVINFGKKGIKFHEISPSLAFLEQYKGALEWENHFRLLILKLISFNIDYLNAVTDLKRQSEVIVDGGMPDTAKNPAVLGKKRIDHAHSGSLHSSSNENNYLLKHGIVEGGRQNLQKNDKDQGALENNSTRSNAMVIITPDETRSIHYSIGSSSHSSNRSLSKEATSSIISPKKTADGYSEVFSPKYIDVKRQSDGFFESGKMKERGKGSQDSNNTSSCCTQESLRNGELTSDVERAQEARAAAPISYVTIANKDIGTYTITERMKMNQKMEDYNLLNYLCYCTYMPLFLAGPTSTYNLFISQFEHPSKLLSWRIKINYTIRVAFNYVMLMLFTHFIYANALFNNEANWPLWSNINPIFMIAIGIYALLFIWLKFVFMWRFTRLWSMWNHIEVEENMHRCIFNTFSIERFWRGWHKTFNIWILRYIYIPLGGLQNKMLLSFIVFYFVALWHDFTTQMLAWGTFFSVGMAIETLVRTIGTGNKYPWIVRLQNHKRFIIICLCCNAFSAGVLLIGNMVGFSFKFEGLVHMLQVVSGSAMNILLFIIGTIWVSAATALFATATRDIENYTNKT